MNYYNREDIENLEKQFRINLVNSLSGYKSANLIATKSKDEITNVAIYSSVIHLGSNPPLLGGSRTAKRLSSRRRAFSALHKVPSTLYRDENSRILKKRPLERALPSRAQLQRRGAGRQPHTTNR